MRVSATAGLLYKLYDVHAYGSVMSAVRPLFYGAREFPHFALRASGCRLEATNGSEYVDWLFSGGTVILGYRHPRVEEAIIRQLEAGPTLTFTSPIEVELAERLVSIIPCADSIAFGKNGSDALTAAVRLCRAATGREIILYHGFHGFHDWYAATAPEIAGIPEALRGLTIAFPYNDLDALQALFAEHEGRVAGVVMEPTKLELPADGYLQAVRELTRQNGAILVFDEVVTSLRLGLAGAQGMFGVTPDVACFGKALANGMPISAIGGSREVMRRYPTIGVGMTFQNETLSMAAALATLDVLAEEPVAEHIARTGERIRAGFIDATTKLGIDGAMSGHPSRMTMRFAATQRYPSDYLLGAFITECLKRGIVTNGSILPCYAHDEAAIDVSVRAMAESLYELQHATRELQIPAWSMIGEPGLAGYLDEIDRGSTLDTIAGWALIDASPAMSIVAAVGGESVIATRVERVDVAQALGNPHYVRAGFRLSIPASDDNILLTITADSGRSTQCVLRMESERLPLPLVSGGLLRS